MTKIAVIFDLDGVIVSTDEYHYQAWSRLAKEEGIYFDRKINDRLRGVSRMDSLEIILEQSTKDYTDAEKAELATRKNKYYQDFLVDLKPEDILPGVNELLQKLKEAQIKIAIGSSSKNTPLILKQIGLDDFFDAVADGNQITNSKPDPEIFLLAANKLGVAAEKCVVIEDAEAGIDAALAAGMKAVGVSAAAAYEKTEYALDSLENIDLISLMK